VSLAAPTRRENTTMTDTDPLQMTIELLGGLALFLYGMEKLTEGLKAAAGQQMNTLLARLTGTPVLGAITGAIVTAVIQSSSVTTVLVVGFVSAGLMTLVQSVGVIFGANVGTTVTAQIVAFNTTALAYPLIAIGFGLGFFIKQGVARHYGAMTMGLGLIFLGMGIMGSAMAPLRTNVAFAELLQSLQNPVLGMLAGAVFTALVQSSSATIGLAVVMATQGLLTLPAGIAILFGAKIGTGITAVLAALGKPKDAQRAAAIHVMFNVLGALIWLPFIPQLAALATMVSPVAADLQGVQRLAEEVPRQIANAAMIWATANTVVFLPFAAGFAAVATRLIPDRPADGEAAAEPKFLDDALTGVPSMALERARMELAHMGELTEAMLAQVKAAFRSRDLGALSRQHAQVAQLREAVIAYLQRIGRGALSDTESDEHADLVAAVGEVEFMSAAISRDLAPLAQSMKDAGIEPSSQTADLLDRLFEATQASAHAGLRALVARDEAAARIVAGHRETIVALTSELLRQQSARLALDDPDRLLKHRAQFELIDKLRRVYSAAEHMAGLVLPRSAPAP
jgi:phosphate:Na+ symporter